MIWLVLIITTLATARVTRFVVSDDLWKEMREALVRRLQHPAIAAHRDRHPQTDEIEYKSRHVMYFHMKVATLITCPWCVSLYVAGGALLLLWWFTDYQIPVPVFTWPALSMAATLLIEVTDGVKQVQLMSKQGQD
jgi:hypothetical protein